MENDVKKEGVAQETSSNSTAPARVRNSLSVTFEGDPPTEAGEKTPILSTGVKTGPNRAGQPPKIQYTLNDCEVIEVVCVHVVYV